MWQVDDNGEDASEDEKKKDVDNISGDKLIQTAKKKKTGMQGIRRRAKLRNDHIDGYATNSPSDSEGGYGDCFRKLYDIDIK